MTDLISVMLTIYGESRGEVIEGQIAVGCVIRNRVKKENKTYEEICHAPEQFSCWNDNDPNRQILLNIANDVERAMIGNPSLVQCQFITEGIISGELMDNTKGALNYLSADLFNSPKRPHWALTVGKVIELGNQVFFSV